MKTINTLNIFEASYYLTLPDNSLADISLRKNGFINYRLFCSDSVEEFDGLSTVNLQSYLWKFKDLYKESLKLQNDESFLIQGGLS